MWHDLIERNVLVCPVCRSSSLEISSQISCVSCGARYLIEDGVPIFIRPDDLIDLPRQVMRSMGLADSTYAQVATALAGLTRYKIRFSAAEFSNFFARLERNNVPAARKLSALEVELALDNIELLAAYLPPQMQKGTREYRTVRIKNNSDVCLFSSEVFPLYMSYRLIQKNGITVADEPKRTELPIVLRPGEELSVPVLVEIPQKLEGQVTINFCFVLENVRWFDKRPLGSFDVQVEKYVSTIDRRTNNTLKEFDFAEDMRRSAEFLKLAIDRIPPPENRKKRVLEIGAGVHPMILQANIGDCELIASDLSLVQQQFCKIIYERHEANQKGLFAVAAIDAMNLPFVDGEIDAIVCCAALHHFPMPDVLLRKMKDALSRDGCFIALREPCFVNPYDGLYRSELANGFDEQMFELSEWEEIVKRGGLKIADCQVDFGCSLKMELVKS